MSETQSRVARQAEIDRKIENEREKSGGGRDKNKTRPKAIDLSKENELTKRVANLHGSEKYKAIANYILGILKGRTVSLSDGKKQ